jgi:hypothetical protein
MCQACRDGTCARSAAAAPANTAPINPTINTGEISFVYQTPAMVVPATIEWKPLVTWLCVSVGLIVLVGVVGTELDNLQQIERERKFNTTIDMMKELADRLSPSAF